jgi:hypothetical protein
LLRRRNIRCKNSRRAARSSASPNPIERARGFSLGEILRHRNPVEQG